MFTTVLKIPHVCNGQKLQIVEILPPTLVTHHSYVDSSAVYALLRHHRMAGTAYNDLAAAYTFGGLVRTPARPPEVDILRRDLHHHHQGFEIEDQCYSIK